MCGRRLRTFFLSAGIILCLLFPSSLFGSGLTQEEIQAMSQDELLTRLEENNQKLRSDLEKSNQDLTIVSEKLEKSEKRLETVEKKLEKSETTLKTVEKQLTESKNETKQAQNDLTKMTELFKNYEKETKKERNKSFFKGVGIGIGISIIGYSAYKVYDYFK